MRRHFRECIPYEDCFTLSTWRRFWNGDRDDRVDVVQQAAVVWTPRQKDHHSLRGGSGGGRRSAESRAKRFGSNFKHAQAPHCGFVFKFHFHYAPCTLIKMARPPLSIIVPSTSNSCITDFGTLEPSIESDPAIVAKRARHVRFEAAGLPSSSVRR